jgi:uncharacterized membrane protein
MLPKMKSNSLIARIWLCKTGTERLLLFSCLFSFCLLIIRVIATEKFVFMFLPWNLFLAFIPYVIASWLMAHPAWIENRPKLTFVFVIWLLFIPNSFYILTDLYHLELSKDSPRWFDLTLIFSFAWNGMVWGVLAVRKMEIIASLFLKKGYVLFFIYPVMWLIALGIYIGRYMRFNSWDIITNPFSLFEEIAEMFFRPGQYAYAWGMVFLFSTFITLVYLTIRRIGLSFNEKQFINQ